MGLFDFLLRRWHRAFSPQVERIVDTLWSEAADRQRVREALATYGQESYEHEKNRVRLAILKLSGDDVERVLSTVATAKQDYRNVLMWAEYPEEGRALWPLKPSLTAEDQARLEKLRATDRQQHEEWLKKPGK
jgi:hypothetical protein